MFRGPARVPGRFRECSDALTCMFRRCSGAGSASGGRRGVLFAEQLLQVEEPVAAD
ncbi:hypothetical protein ACVWXU_008825 [Streptomyces sp. TE33382]